jgi:hypothetical protein
MANEVKAATSPATMSAEQAREERAYATGIQAALWGRLSITHKY